MANELQAYFDNLPAKVRRNVTGEFKALVDGFAATVKAAAPEGPTGKTKASVRVTQGRNDLELNIEAGGSLTTKAVRVGATATYDYALGGEFGNSHMSAQPWFYPTYRANREDWARQLQELAAKSITDS